MNILEYKEVKTRKDHTCWGCVKKFKKGSKMITCVSVDDTILRIYHCPTCEQIQSKTNDDSYYTDFGYPKGWVIDEMDSKDFKGTIEEFLKTLKGEENE